jgi:AcrR family transcriptional regulator
LSVSSAPGAAVGVQWRDYGQPAVAPLLQAALECFVESGYHGTTIRNVAAAAGLSVPGLYHHYESKHAILVALMQSAMTDLYARSVAALEEAGDSLQDRLDLQIECLVLFHAHRTKLAFIAASEIRSLEPGARARHIAARDRQQRLLDEIVDEGVTSAIFTAEQPRDASRAIVTMCTGVAQWYRLSGALSPDQLARLYVRYARRLLGQRVAEGPPEGGASLESPPGLLPTELQR